MSGSYENVNQAWNDGGVAKAVEERQISIKMSVLSKTQDELNGALNELTKRLDPVLFPPIPEIVAEKDARDMGKPRDPSCPLAFALQGRIDEVIRQTRIVGDLISRLGV